MKKFGLAMTAMLLAVSMTACASNPSDSGEQKLRIGIIQPAEHAALDSAREGFVDALADHGYVDGETIEIDYQNAQGDSSALLTISQRFVGDDCDLVLAIGTGAAQSIASQTSEIPVLITAVTDPVDAGLVQSNEAPGTNITGTNDMNPIREQMELIREFLPDVQTVGLLYTSSEDNSVLQIQEVKTVLEEMNVGYVEQTVTGSNDVQQAVQSILGKCDALYIPTDNTLAASAALVGSAAQTAKIPVFWGEGNCVAEGGLASLGLDYYNLGRQTGEMAVEVLEGADPAVMPIQSQSDYSYTISKSMAEEIGIEIPAHLLEFAE